MDKITLVFLIALTNFIYSQDVVDYSKKLNYHKGFTIIDGTQIDPKARYANIKTDFIVFADRSALTFTNCIVKVDGQVDASANCKIRLLNSYIICKKYSGPPSNGIIQTNNIEYAILGDVKYIKKIKGNPKLEIIDMYGKTIIKGSKESILKKKIKTGIYDVRSSGNFYDTKILLATY